MSPLTFILDLHAAHVDGPPGITSSEIFRAGLHVECTYTLQHDVAQNASVTQWCCIWQLPQPACYTLAQPVLGPHATECCLVLMPQDVA